MENEYLYLFIKKEDLEKHSDNKNIIKEITSKKLKELYGDTIDTHIKERYNYELNQILSNNFENIYMLAYTIAQKAKKDKRIFVLKFSSSSSLIAYLLDISFVNPIEYNIPFEIFANFEGDKTPHFEFIFSYNYITDIYEYTKCFLKENNLLYSHSYDENLLLDHHIISLSFQKSNIINILEELKKITCIEPNNITINDKQLLNFLQDDITLDIFELNTEKAKAILKKINPKNINELIKIYALLNSDNVWENNVEYLIEEHSLDELACSREDLYHYLMINGLEKEIAFKIMEFTRKGKVGKDYCKEKWNLYVDIMKKHNIPDWYISSLEKISYLSPRAYCCNLAIISLWLAWYKTYHPEQFNNIINNEEKQ